jgi:hypothetical protein
MGRPEKRITRTGPVSDLAVQLRRLRQHAHLTLRELSRRTGLSIATLSHAQGGERPPTWSTVSTFVAACGGRPDDWQARWDKAAHRPRAESSVPLPPSDWVPTGPRSVVLRPFKGSVAHQTRIHDLERVTYEDALKTIERALQGEEPGADPRRKLAETLFTAWNEAATYYTVRDNAARTIAGPPPLPVPANTVAEFLDSLLRVKIWAGDPAMRALAARANMSKTGLYDTFAGRRGLPSNKTLLAILSACGVTDPGTVQHWVFAWQRLAYEAEIARRRHRAAGRRHLATA